MASKDVAVVFGPNGPRIYHGIDPNAFKGVANCLINPALPPGIPPHEWKLSGGLIIEKTAPEKASSAPQAPFTPKQALDWRHYSLLAATLIAHIIMFCLK